MTQGNHDLLHLIEAALGVDDIVLTYIVYDFWINSVELVFADCRGGEARQHLLVSYPHVLDFRGYRHPILVRHQRWDGSSPFQDEEVSSLREWRLGDLIANSEVGEADLSAWLDPGRVSGSLRIKPEEAGSLSLTAIATWAAYFEFIHSGVRQHRLLALSEAKSLWESSFERSVRARTGETGAQMHGN